MGRLYIKDSGYFNPRRALDSPAAIVMVVGGRGVGKTYGVLQELYRRGTQHFYLRRTQSQIDIAMSVEMCPWNAIPGVMEEMHLATINKYCRGLYYGTAEDGEIGPPLVIGAALSTFSNIRGISAPHVTHMVFDEFIPEPHERPIKNEGAALLNAYETINRNRELEGKEPVKLVCLANSNQLNNPLFAELGIVEMALRMQQTGEEVRYMPERGIELLILNNSKISKRKGSTAIYKAANNSSMFYKSGIQNAFAVTSVPVKSHRLNGYKAVWCIGGITIYKPPTNSLQWYVSTVRSGDPLIFADDEEGRARFKAHAAILFPLSLQNRIDYETYTCYTELRRLYSNK